MDYIRKLINYMELHYMENIMAKDLAKSCELSETHMRRIFLEYTNATPLEYLNLVRINKACELLMKGNCSVESVIRAGRIHGFVHLYAEFQKDHRTFP